MNDKDQLLSLLIEFFGLTPDTSPEEITQAALPSWDSLAMVQLITELQGTFSVEFDLDEIERLRTYHEIRDTLRKKGVVLPASSPERPVSS